MPRETWRAEDPSTQRWGSDLSRGSGREASREPDHLAMGDPRSVLPTPADEAVRRSRSVEIRSRGTQGRSYFAVAPATALRSGGEGPVRGAADYSKGGIPAGKDPSARKTRLRQRDGQRVPPRPSTPGIGTDQPPPTPWGCEWRRVDDGWNLWRCWSERETPDSPRVRRSRYAGFLSLEGWEVLKGYDYETFLAILGQRLRRYGKR